MITIFQPQVVTKDGYATLQAVVDIDGKKDTIWFKVSEKFGDYLCYERSDAYVIGLLNYAMRNGHDITCEAPMGEDLYYQLTTYLIESVYKGSDVLYKTKIISKVDSSSLKLGNAVATGISCGIDSLHVLSQQSESLCKSLNLTHLVFNNVGSHGEGLRAQTLFAKRKQLVVDFCNEHNFELIVSDSNLMNVIPQNHFLSHTYSSCFAIYILQKLYNVYYYASGVSFLEFNLKDNERKDVAYYDLLLLSMLSTRDIKIHSEGAPLTRFEKTQRVVDYPPSYTYLNVCTQDAHNCGLCEKCIRTLVSLDALGKLELYNKVFNIDYYKNNRSFYLSKLYFYYKLGKSDYIESYATLKKDITFLIKLKTIFDISNIKSLLVTCFPQGKLRSALKKVYKILFRK